MPSEFDTGFEDYKELAESELEPGPKEEDSRPVSSQPHDWTISTLRDKHERGSIDLQPHYQREYVWDLKPELPSRLVESILLEIPIPPIYFGKLPGNKLEVIDGQQRLTTLIRFVRNEFALQKLQKLASLSGKFFRDLPNEDQEKVLDASIRSIVIDTGTNHNLRYEVFERLNRGAMALNEQELRNCVYRGSFCDLLGELERDTRWREVKGGKDPERRFVEREMILRFFAFANRIDQYGGNLKRFLNDYMANHAPKDPQQLSDQAEMFRQTMRNVKIAFGPHAGRLYYGNVEDPEARAGRWDHKFSVSALDIQASAMIGHNPAKVQGAADQIRELYMFYLLTNRSVRDAIAIRASSTDSTRTRWFGFKAEVQDLLNKVQVEPRFFSYTYRKQLYDADPKCRLCGNQILTFEDSTVDHITPYSKGGKTDPENGQLAHMLCNARKCATFPG